MGSDAVENAHDEQVIHCKVGKRRIRIRSRSGQPFDVDGCSHESGLKPILALLSTEASILPSMPIPVVVTGGMRLSQGRSELH